MKFTYYITDHKGNVHPKYVTTTTDAESYELIRAWNLQHINWEFGC